MLILIFIANLSLSDIHHNFQDCQDACVNTAEIANDIAEEYDRCLSDCAYDAQEEIEQEIGECRTDTECTELCMQNGGSPEDCADVLGDN